MPPLPKRRTSKARHRERRSHLSLTAPATEPCPRCHALKLPHTICTNCGTYGGEEVIKPEGKRKT